MNGPEALEQIATRLASMAGRVGSPSHAGDVMREIAAEARQLAQTIKDETPEQIAETAKSSGAHERVFAALVATLATPERLQMGSVGGITDQGVLIYYDDEIDVRQLATVAIAAASL